MARKSRISRLVVPPLLFFLLLAGTTQCEARPLRRSKKNSLLNALLKLNFIKTVEPTHLPPPANPSSNGDDVSLAAADSGDGTNPPFCVNPPNSPSTPPFTSTPSTPSIPDQPPPLPPISPTPPSFEPSPPESSTPSPSPPMASTPNPPQLGPSPPESVPSPIFVAPNPPESVPSPIFVAPSPPTFVPSPPEFGPGGPGGSGGGFLPPIVYPPPLAPPLPPGTGQALWCVAKPTVPDPIIQEAMDYACGSGAECKSVQPSGACYQPNTVLAHASYAFNSFWQMTKASGGTCDFGGTATIVTRDPSYEKCEFNLL